MQCYTSADETGSLHFFMFWSKVSVKTRQSTVTSKCIPSLTFNMFSGYTKLGSGRPLVNDWGMSVTLRSHWLTYTLENRTINRAKSKN